MPQKSERKIQTKMPKLELQGRMLPSTVNEEARTVEMVFTTSSPARMYRFKGWDIEEFNEVLSMEQGHVRMGRMESGAPLLDSHARFQLKDQIGVVERAWVEGEELRGLVRFSKREDVESIFQDVKDGIIRNGSIGYRVYKYEDISADDDKVKTLRATDWEPVEMSLVPVGADAQAGTRSESFEQKEEKNEVVILTRNLIEGDEMPEVIKKEEPQTAAAPVVDEKAIAQKAIQEERTRSSEIKTAVRKAKLSDEFAETLIEQGVASVDAYKFIVDELATKDAQAEIRSTTPDIKVGREEQMTRREAGVEALLHRASPAENAMTEKGRAFGGFSLMEMARHFLSKEGLSTMGGRADVAQRALHSSSDFSHILANVANKSIQKGYMSTIATHKVVGRRVTIPDFKEKKVTRLGEFPSLKKVPEGAEVTYGTIGDSAEAYALATYARNFAITRQVIINDDMDALSRMPAMAGRAAGDLELDVFWAIVTANANMADGSALFSTAHLNLIASGSAISNTSMSAMKAKLRGQKNDKARYINAAGKFVLVNQEREGEAEDVLANSSGSGGFNRHGGKYELVVEPRLTAASNPWYIMADYNQIDTLEYGYLEGQEGLFIEDFQSADHHGLIIRVTLDFGAAAIDWKGIVKNPGA